ncbi:MULTISPECIES: hypothetical protein [Streptomyces]|uniref:hypothetical protein n=1 Tax=Streptomyces TaxID=1883 RepID=UPI0004DAF6EF|nr:MULTISPECIES: hypothetical protein [Streptomyces]
MTTSADLPLRPGIPRPVPAPGDGDRPGAPAAPRADCIADSAGGLTFDVEAPGRAESWDAALLLRRRGGRDGGAAGELRLPLVPAGRGRLRAVLPSTVVLPEGRWDAYEAAPGAEPVRLTPGISDLRTIVDRHPDPGRGSVAVRLPYATKHGNLSVRSWLRSPHAEAGDLHVRDGELLVEGRLYGAVPGPGAAVEVRCRRDPSEIRTVPVTADGTRFSCTLPYPEFAGPWQGGDEPWDLWLRPAAGAGAVRISRILDDVADKKAVFGYPVRPLSTPRGPALIGPYYTVDNDLSVRLTEPEPGPGPEAGKG